MAFVDSSAGSNGGSGNLFSPLGLSGGQAAGLGLGAAGLGYLISKGPSPLPTQFGQVTSSVPQLQAEGAALEGEGAALTSQGASALAQGQAGILTDPQKASLDQYRTGLTNEARQMYFNMGRNPDQDTTFLSTTADIDAKVNAMAQQDIQTTLQLGLGETQAGLSFSGQGLGFETAANNALLEAGKAQLQQDKDYSDSLTNVFSAIGKIFGGAVGIG